MDKKTTYYIIAAVVLVAIIGIVIAMQKPAVNPTPPTTGDKTNTPKTVKTEVDVVRDIAKQLNLSDGQMPLRVTMDDNSQSASLTPGKNLALMLGDTYNWQIVSSDEKVLIKKNITVSDARVQAVYQVVGAGNAVLSATGACKTNSKCATPTAAFKFNVEGVVSENVAPADLVK
jgi:hypothetical protein